MLCACQSLGLGGGTYFISRLLLKLTMDYSVSLDMSGITYSNIIYIDPGSVSVNLFRFNFCGRELSL